MNKIFKIRGLYKSIIIFAFYIIKFGHLIAKKMSDVNAMVQVQYVDIIFML